MTLKVRILQFSTTFTQVYTRPKIFLFGSSLAFTLKEGPVRCAKVCNKSWVILMCQEESSDRNTLTFNFRIQCPKSLRQAKVQIFWGGHISFSNLTILKYEMSKIFWDLFKMLWSKYVLRISELYENFVLAKQSAVKSQFILSKYR